MDMRKQAVPNNQQLFFPRDETLFQATNSTGEMIRRESYVPRDQNQQPRVQYHLSTDLPQQNLSQINPGSFADQFNYTSNPYIEPAPLLPRGDDVVLPFESGGLVQSDHRYKTLWNTEEAAMRLFTEHFDTLNEFSPCMPQAAPVASWCSPSLNPVVPSSTAPYTSSSTSSSWMSCAAQSAPAVSWPQLNSSTEQQQCTLELPTDDALNLQLHTGGTRLLQSELKRMFQGGQRLGQDPWDGKRGSEDTVDHQSHGSQNIHEYLAAGHGAMQLHCDRLKLSIHSDPEIRTSTTRTRREVQLQASARPAPQDLQLQLAIGSNDPFANSRQQHQSFPAHVAPTRKRNAPPILVDYSSSSKLKRPCEEPLTSKNDWLSKPGTIPVATTYCSSSLFSSYHSYHSGNTFVGKSSMNSRPKHRTTVEGAAATTKLHTIPEDLPCNLSNVDIDHAWNLNFRNSSKDKRPCCPEPLTIDKWLQKSATTSTAGATTVATTTSCIPTVATTSNSGHEFSAAAYPGFIFAGKRSWNDPPNTSVVAATTTLLNVKTEDLAAYSIRNAVSPTVPQHHGGSTTLMNLQPCHQQQQDQPQSQWWVPAKAITNCTSAAALYATSSEYSAFLESKPSVGPSYSSLNYNPSSWNTLNPEAAAAAASATNMKLNTSTTTKDVAPAWRSCTPAAPGRSYNIESTLKQPTKFMDLLLMDSATDNRSTSGALKTYSDPVVAALELYNCAQDASFMKPRTIQPAAAAAALEVYNCAHDASFMTPTIQPAAAAALELHNSAHDASFMSTIQPAAAAYTSDPHLLALAAAAAATPASQEHMNLVTGSYGRGLLKKDSPLQMCSKVESGQLHFEVTQLSEDSQPAAAVTPISYEQDHAAAAAAAATLKDYQVAEEDGLISCFRFSKEELLQYIQGKISISREGTIVDHPGVGPCVSPDLRSYKSLPPAAVTVFQNWMAEHFHKPYPNEIEKDVLCLETGMSKKKLERWFSNARYRFWKPLVEGMHNQLLLLRSDKNRNITIKQQQQLLVVLPITPPSPSPSTTASPQDDDDDDDNAATSHQQAADRPSDEEEGSSDEGSSDGA